MLVFGAGSAGQLGIGTTPEAQTSPVRCPGPPDLAGEPLSIAAGGSHLILVTSSGRLFATGNNQQGQLAFSDTINRTQLDSIATMLSKPKIKSVAAGWAHTLFLDEEGSIRACGTTEHHILGFALAPTPNTNSLSRCIAIPVQIPLTVRIAKVFAGLRHSAVLTTTGKVLLWGDNRYCQCARKSSPQRFVSAPTEADRPLPWEASRVVSVACGSRHTIFTDETGGVFAAGDNKFFQCGIDRSDPICPPIKIPIIASIKQVAVGWNHTVMLTAEGQVWACGRAEFGQLGLGPEITTRQLPRKVDLEQVVSVACGSEHSLVLDAEGRVFSFGWAEHGQLGHGDVVNVFVPKLIEGIEKVQSIHCGAGFSVLILARPSGGSETRQEAVENSILRRLILLFVASPLP